MASSSFYKDAPRMLGMAPQSYRRRGQDQRIRFAWPNARWAACWWPAPSGRVLRAAGR
jgi:hypothetical protein